MLVHRTAQMALIAIHKIQGVSLRFHTECRGLVAGTPGPIREEPVLNLGQEIIYRESHAVKVYSESRDKFNAFLTLVLWR